MKDDLLKTLPKPAADDTLYRSVINAGFEAFPERLKNFQVYKKAVRGEKVDYLPIKLDIENVSRCNYRCVMCQVSDWPKMTRAEDMSFEDFKAVIDEQYGVMELKLQGVGEPLLGKSYFDMLSYARSKHIWVRSTTNASLLHLKDNYKRIVDADVCELQISVDGTTKESYEAIRRGGIFEKMSENCKLVNQYGRDTKRHRTRMWTVVQEANFSELKNFPVFAAELGFARLTLSLEVFDWGQERWKEITKDLDRSTKFTFELGKELIAIGKERGVEVTFWFSADKFNTESPKGLCHWPFERAYISSDMRVVPCCLLGNPEVSDLGSAKNFTDLWNSESYQNFRRAHLTGNIPTVCKTCYK